MLPQEAPLVPERLSSEERAAASIRRLPKNLGEAIDLFEQSDFCREVLGEHIYSYLLKEKKAEWEEYGSIVTDWEVQKCYVGI